MSNILKKSWDVLSESEKWEALKELCEKLRQEIKFPLEGFLILLVQEDGTITATKFGIVPVNIIPIEEE